MSKFAFYDGTETLISWIQETREKLKETAFCFFYHIGWVDITNLFDDLMKTKISFIIHPIGTVHGNEIRMDKKWTCALKGIEGFSHIIVLCWLDRAKIPKMLIRPKGLARQPKIGLLATRTPHRGNPLAMTVVKLLKRRGDILYVDGLDVWEGTPVIDIKPYTKRDAITKYRIPSWVKIWDKMETDPLRKFAR